VAPAVVIGGGFEPVRLEIGIPWFVPPRPVRISLFVGLAKPAAIEELVESCVQLGADRIGFFASSAPLATGRRGGPSDGGFNEREVLRLSRIARESCRVSKRPRFCEITYRAFEPAELMEQAASQSCSIMVCDEAPLHSSEGSAASDGHAHLLGSVMGLDRKPGGVWIVIGPESGLSEEDKSQLARHAQLKGLTLEFVSLGSGILTVPNAARSALAQVDAALSLKKW
jgi:RsmE family RNA methyltransferase